MKTGSNFLLFYFYCSIVFIIFFYKEWGLEFLMKLFLGSQLHFFQKSAIADRVNAVLTPF